jgi:hypothetical protein
VLASTIDAAGVKAIARRSSSRSPGSAPGRWLARSCRVVGVAVFTAFVIYFWLPISGEMGRARSRAALADAEELASQDGPHRAAGAPDEPGLDRGRPAHPGRRYSNVGWPES